MVKMEKKINGRYFDLFILLFYLRVSGLEEIQFY